MRYPRISALFAAGLALSATTVVGHAVHAEAATTKPVVLLVHGVKPNNFTTMPGLGTDCVDYFGDAVNSLSPTNTVKTIGFYTNDQGCSDKLVVKNDLGLPMSSVTINTEIHRIGKALAWYIYDNYSSKGVTIKVAGHSMGGILVFDALQETALHHPGYPPYLSVNRAVTMVAPIGGMRPQLNATCQGVECEEFKSGASSEPYTLSAGVWLHDRLGFNTRCASPGADATSKPAVPTAGGPSGTGETLWASIGSEFDTVVSSCSATSIASNPIKVLPLSHAVNHNEIQHDAEGLAFLVANLDR